MVTNNELARLADLLSYDILDTPEEDDLNEIVRLASSICGMPISLISLIDENRQWFKAKIGLVPRETPREYAFCAHAILGTDTFIVSDATEDDRFKNNPLVQGDPNIRFYAGVPLTTPQGQKLGTLCVIDDRPGELSAEQERALRILARQVVSHFELKKKNKVLQSTLQTIDSQRNQLENHNQILTRLLSIISHDLRNPLENLKQLFGMFVNGDLTTDELKMLGSDVNKSLASTSELLNNLLGWASSQISGMGMNVNKVDLQNLVNEQLEAVELSASHKKNKLLNEVPAGTVILADADMLKFMVRNLVTNANKFTHSGTLKVTLEKDLEFYRIKISDTGCGMSAERIEKLFNWKKRQTSPGTAGEKGSGLGLLISQQFAHQHNGSLWVQSVEGEGTTVFVEIAKNLKVTD